MKFLILPLIALNSCLYASEWSFSTPDNPSMAIDGKAAVIDVGEFSTGWWGEPFLETETTGFWDLGASGQVTASLAPANRITVTTLEWMDGGIFSEWAAIEIAGFTNVMTYVTEVEPSPLLGGWWQKVQVLQGPITQTPQITIHGSANGTLLNNLTVQCEVPVVTRTSRARNKAVTK